MDKGISVKFDDSASEKDITAAMDKLESKKKDPMTSTAENFKYRVREHRTKETLTDDESTVYYTIEKRSRRWFGLFGPEVWVTLQHEVMGYCFDNTWGSEAEAMVACQRMNNNLPTYQTTSRVVG